MDSLILIDEINYAQEVPVNNLDSYTNAIVKIIKQSEPKFTIGIYGEWGNGKTTLMKRVQYSLEKDKKNITVVWFNAWRYEREEYYGVTALLKSIAIELDRTGHYKELASLLKRSVFTLGKDILRQVASQFISDHGIKDFEKNLLPKLEGLSDIDRDTIYFDGLRIISEKFKEIRDKNPQKRIVVFVDDLDRCSPKKALELFESTKAFLDIEGFIFVIGLSHETVSKIITEEYKLHGIKGADYIKKIIQIPIHTPVWVSSGTEDLIKNLISKLDPVYKNALNYEEYFHIIADSLEKNPREIKRFLNNLIVALEIYRDKEVKMDELLIAQILNMRWNNFYDLLMKSTDFRKELWELLTKKPEEIMNEIALALDADSKYPVSRFNKLLSPYGEYDDLWVFLVNHKSILERINWEIYHQAVKSSSEIPIKVRDSEVLQDELNYFIENALSRGIILNLKDGYMKYDPLYDLVRVHIGKPVMKAEFDENLQLLRTLNVISMSANLDATTSYGLTQLGLKILDFLKDYRTDLPV